MALRKRLGAAAAATAAVALAFGLSGCGTSKSSSDAAGSGATALSTVGKGEGSVSILAWPGYVEDGSNDPKVDWVSPFEKETGCKVQAKTYGTSDEAFNLMKQGGFDVVAASGDLSLRLIAADTVQPINTDLTPNYKNVYSFLKNRDWNSKDGKAYGIPHGYGANLLMYNTKTFKTAPDSWDVVFDKAGEHKGKIGAYDSPIYIADAAMYLMSTQPDLGIKNQYSLDEKQLAAATDLLKKQRPNVHEYWSDYLKSVQAMENGSEVASTGWQVILNSMDKGADVKGVVPKEGVTGWSDTWMVSSKTEHPSCSYQWLNYMASGKASAAATEYFGEAPNNPQACKYASDPKFCKTYHAGDEAYAKKIWYWTTPVQDCLDGRTDVKCTDYADWTKAWQDIKG